MKKNNILWAVLPMMAAALMTTACSNDDNVNESPTEQSTVKTIPYSVTVNDGATTRATVDSDNKTLKFAAGDKLYITGTNIKGTLDIQTGMGTASATFSGTLNYTGEGTPPDDTLLRGWLIGSGDKLFTITDGEVKGYTYPATYCADVATAVKEYSYLWNTADVTYASRTFTLEQQTAFLNFEITFEDGTAAGTTLTTVVSNNGSVIATAEVTTKTDTYGNVVAEFVLPFDTGNKLKGATVKMGDKEAISFGGADQTLEGKVYNVKKTQYTPISAATTSDYGKVVCAAGHLHDAKTAVPAGCTAVGILGKVTETGHGLILALKDAAQQYWNTINGWTSVTTYASTTLKVLPDDDARGSLTSYTTLGTTAVSNWAVAQKSDYEAIFTNLGSTTGDDAGTTYNANVNAFITTGVGGTAISGNYWSATKYDGSRAWLFLSEYWFNYDLTFSHSVRPVLAF